MCDLKECDSDNNSDGNSDDKIPRVQPQTYYGGDDDEKLDDKDYIPKRTTML